MYLIVYDPDDDSAHWIPVSFKFAVRLLACSRMQYHDSTVKNV